MNLKKWHFLACLFIAGVITACTKKDLSNNTGGIANINSKLKTSASPVGDVVGKITVGYQGWFAATGDGSPINAWWHWAQNWGAAPSPSNQGIKSWPDVRDYATTFQTAYSNLGNGQPAKLFSSFTNNL